MSKAKNMAEEHRIECMATLDPIPNVAMIERVAQSIFTADGHCSREQAFKLAQVAVMTAIKGGAA